MPGSMARLVEDLFAAHPGHLPYLAHGDDVRTRADLHAQVRAEAAVFAGCGITEGSTVLLQVPPSYTQVQAMLALWSLGAQVMLVDHRFKTAEVDGIRSVGRPQFTVRGGQSGATPSFAREYELCTSHHPTGEPADTGHRLVQFSSGSTGAPKMIGRTPESIAAEIDRFTRIDGMPSRGERVLLLSSTAHSFGLIAGLLHSLARGVAAVFPARVSAADMLAAAARHDVHLFFGTPFHYELLGTARELPALPSLRGAVSGGEIMDPAVAARFEAKFGFAVGESYGSTETGVIAMDVSGRMRPSVGRAAPVSKSGCARTNWRSRSPTGRRICGPQWTNDSRTAGSAPATARRSAPTAGCACAAAATRSWSSAGSRSTSARSRPPCASTPR